MRGIGRLAGRVGEGVSVFVGGTREDGERTGSLADLRRPGNSFAHVGQARENGASSCAPGVSTAGQ